MLKEAKYSAWIFVHTGGGLGGWVGANTGQEFAEYPKDWGIGELPTIEIAPGIVRVPYSHESAEFVGIATGPELAQALAWAVRELLDALPEGHDQRFGPLVIERTGPDSWTVRLDDGIRLEAKGRATAYRLVTGQMAFTILAELAETGESLTIVDLGYWIPQVL